jgi:branched-subunit amino acid ABC-type transport system permease component
MPDVFVWLLMSLGAGAAYALLGNGIVAIYKGSGVLNFAQGGVAMFATWCYVALIDGGTPEALAVVIVMAGSAIGGMLLAGVVLRPLRNAPTLAKVLATLGLLIALQGLAALIWGSDPVTVPTLLPNDGISLGDHGFVGEDRLYMAGIAIVVTVLLWAAFRFSRLGLATQAVSQSERGAALLGFSPTVISAFNWGLGSALAALAGILIAPVTSLDTASMPLVVLPALAAALVGRFSSFWITTLAAFGIGWAETVVFQIWTQPGAQTAAPFLVVILVMVIAGKALPSRGALSTGRPPHAPVGFRNRWIPAVAFSGVAVVLFAVFDNTYSSGLAFTLTMAILALSLVVLTGFVGQISLMQLTFAGAGALLTAKLATDWGSLPFPVPILLAALIAAPIGVLLGLPALRVRGLSLAIVTLGAAVAVDAVVFKNGDITRGLDGLPVPSPELAGFSLDPFAHPMRYGVFVVVALVLVALLVGNVRRSGIGRRMLAVRSNERAAAVAGVNVSAVKLQAFALSSSIAALSGGVLAYANPFLVLAGGGYGAMPSINILVLAYIGGIAVISGSVVAGVAATGGVLYVLLSNISGFADWFALVSGLGLIQVLIFHPDGVAEFFGTRLRALAGRIGGRRGDGGSPAAPPSAPDRERPRPAAREATAASVDGG